MRLIYKGLIWFLFRTMFFCILFVSSREQNAAFFPSFSLIFFAWYLTYFKALSEVGRCGVRGTGVKKCMVGGCEKKNQVMGLPIRTKWIVSLRRFVECGAGRRCIEPFVHIFQCVRGGDKTRRIHELQRGFWISSICSASQGQCWILTCMFMCMS